MSGWLRRAVYIIVGLIVLVAFWRLSVYLVVEVALERAGAGIVERSQASHLLVRGLLLILAPLFIWALSESLSLPRLWGNRSSRRRRQIANAVLLLAAAGYSLTLYAVSRGKFFTASGQPQKWCAQNPDGIRCYDQPGFDPETGVQLISVTSSEVLAWKRAELGQEPKRLFIESVDNYDFVDTLQGNRPRVWYGLNRQSEIELFDGPGFHPVTSVALQPISLEVIDLYDAQLRRKHAKETELRASEARRLARDAETKQRAAAAGRRAEEARQREANIERYVNRSAISAAPQVVVIDASGNLDAGMAQSIASALRGRTDLFRPAFVAEGLFGSALAGDSRALSSLAVQSNGQIYLFEKRSAVRATNYPEQGLHKAQTRLHGRRYDPIDFSSTVVEVEGVGAAFSAEEAVRRSEREALNQLLDEVR